MTDSTLYPGQVIPQRATVTKVHCTPRKVVIRSNDVVFERDAFPSTGRVYIFGDSYKAPNLCSGLIQDIADLIPGGSYRWVFVQVEADQMSAGWVDTGVYGGKPINEGEAKLLGDTAQWADQRYKRWFSVGWPGSRNRVHLKSLSFYKLEKVLREQFPMRLRS